jgi:tRNA (guanine37-N1)-methyltransferase
MFATESPGVLGVSIPSRAIAAGSLRVHATNIRDFTTDKHQRTDDRPFGGGPGMVMMCQPLWDAVAAVEASDDIQPPRQPRRILLTPQGLPLTQAIVEDLAKQSRLLMIAGHYEGLDERVIEKLAPLELSIGDYVISGGELAALVLIDAIARLLPGVLGHDQSSVQDSFSSFALPPRPKPRRGRGETPLPAAESHPTDPAQPPDAGQCSAMTSASGTPTAPAPPTAARLLDCPHYTKPRSWMGMEVPEVLLSGDHARIEAWRLAQRVERTARRRPELLGTGDAAMFSPGLLDGAGSKLGPTPPLDTGV